MRRFWAARVRVVAVATAVLVILFGGATVAHNHGATVTGGIIPCSGLPIEHGPHYSAGTVTVLKGQVTLRSTGQGDFVDVFPTTVAAWVNVDTNATYHFELEPGQYVLDASFPLGNVVPYVNVTLQPGDDLWVDIPNMCI